MFSGQEQGRDLTAPIGAGHPEAELVRNLLAVGDAAPEHGLSRPKDGTQ